MLKIDAEQYVHTNQFNDEPVTNEGTVSAEFVHNYLAAKSFFDSLVDTDETHKRYPDGRIRVIRRDPEDNVHDTVFYPVKS